MADARQIPRLTRVALGTAADVTSQLPREEVWVLSESFLKCQIRRHSLIPVILEGQLPDKTGKAEKTRDLLVQGQRAVNE